MYKIVLLTLLMVFSNASYSAIKYFDGKIERIETCKSGSSVYVFIKDIVGTTPAASNGCSNDIRLPYVKLNNNESITELEKLMFSIALSAHATDKSIRVRFDDETKMLISIAIN